MSMEQISKIISKKVISLEDASGLGYVLDVIFDDQIKTFTGLIIVDDESENSFVLQREDIYSMGDETVMVKSADKLMFNILNKSNNPVGKIVYDCNGNNLGQVIDVQLQGKTVKKLMTTMCEFPQKFVRKSGDNFIIFGAYKKEKKEKKTFKEEVGTFNSQILPQVTISQAINSVATMEIPKRVYIGENALIGRVMTNDIFGYNNEIIVQKNEIISQKIINKAKKHNKLNFLNYYSK